ncbi:hypothetical protein CASFOL_015070 [Castilleja foliolosa]|uniref:4-coumarate--CoA ligase n=1 Tax=Castilleja foliolosa TaxID=1961234 RepID=A0ABD3DEG5_9LAMI
MDSTDASPMDSTGATPIDEPKQNLTQVTKQNLSILSGDSVALSDSFLFDRRPLLRFYLADLFFDLRVQLEGPQLLKHGFNDAIAKVGLTKFITDLFWVGMFYHLYNQVFGNVLKRVFVIGFSILVFVVQLRSIKARWCYLKYGREYVAANPSDSGFLKVLFVMHGFASLHTQVKKDEAATLSLTVGLQNSGAFFDKTSAGVMGPVELKGSQNGSYVHISLKQVCCGAAPLSKKSISEFNDMLPHVDFIQGYGMTQSTVVGTWGYNTVEVRKYSSVGFLSPNVEAKVVDWVTGSHLPVGSVGELWLRSPGNMKGYLNNIEATNAALDKEGNWLHTGDIVYFDQEGYLYVTDRLKEIIKYKGCQVAPADLEAVLMSHPEVLDAAVTGAIDEEAGEIPVAFVVLKDGSSVSQTAIMDYVAKQAIELLFAVIF